MRIVEDSLDQTVPLDLEDIDEVYMKDGSGSCTMHCVHTTAKLPGAARWYPPSVFAISIPVASRN